MANEAGSLVFCRISREVLRDQPPWIKQAAVPSPPLAEHLFGLVVIGGLLIARPDPAFADWWIVRASDKQCLVVDIEPTGEDKSVTKIGKKAYPTREAAEADVQRLCKQ
jgi:hypothetical protein